MKIQPPLPQIFLGLMDQWKYNHLFLKFFWHWWTNENTIFGFDDVFLPPLYKKSAKPSPFFFWKAGQALLCLVLPSVVFVFVIVIVFVVVFVFVFVFVFGCSVKTSAVTYAFADPSNEHLRDSYRDPWGKLSLSLSLPLVSYYTFCHPPKDTRKEKETKTKARDKDQDQHQHQHQDNSQE